jgi:uncharacterized protein YprB with RNaseH-like and TPR domain
VELRDRLKGLGYFNAPRPQVSPRPTPRWPDLHDVVDGTHRECELGRCFVAETRYPLDHVHAGVALSDLLGYGGEALALLGNDPRLAFLEPERAVLLDIETTGLAGGTGTYAFLIGLGYFADGAFHLDQFFLRDPSEERAMLSVLAATLGRFEAVITFNGKCFDWPLVETRHLYNRVPLRPAAPLHLDLLFPARRLFKRRLGACNLTRLEPGALGLDERQGDVPGWLIPTIYFDYLRGRDGRPLKPVFEHNRLDILTMVALAVQMARQIADPDGASLDDPTDLYSLGRLFEDHGRLDTAVRCYERALTRYARGFDRAEALQSLAATYKRLDDRARAVELWQSMVDADAGSTYPYVELAKHLEHKANEYARAADLTRRAIDRHHANRAVMTSWRWRSDLAELEKRLARLERKLNAGNERGPAAVVASGSAERVNGVVH